jgi:hypothetical protein
MRCMEVPGTIGTKKYENIILAVICATSFPGKILKAEIRFVLVKLQINISFRQGANKLC